MLNVRNAFNRLITCTLSEEDGVTAIEYGLLAALIAVACIVVLQTTGGSLNDLYGYWSDAVIAAIQ